MVAWITSEPFQSGTKLTSSNFLCRLKSRWKMSGKPKLDVHQVALRVNR
jgi:hypothetical protein